MSCFLFPVICVLWLVPWLLFLSRDFFFRGGRTGADIDDAAKEIVYRNYVDISVAVSSPNGLVVPVLRNVEDMGTSAHVLKHIAQ